MGKKRKREDSYIAMAVTSYLIREFLFPNPFSNLFDPIIAEIVNLFFGGVLIALAYELTGTWYVSKKGQYWKGSLGFLVNFSLLGGVILFISKFVVNIYLLIVIFVFVYMLLCILEAKLFGKTYMSF